MEDLIGVAAIVAVTILSIQMGLFFNWALLSLLLKAMNMNRVRSTASSSGKSAPTPATWA